MDKGGAFSTSSGRVGGHATDIFVGDLKSVQYSIPKVTNLFTEIKAVPSISLFVVSAMTKYHLPWDILALPNGNAWGAIEGHHDY
jgi:hypothetical protein